MPPLFIRFPRLREAFQRIEFATLPTPVEPLAGLSGRRGRGGLFVKRDDLSGNLYGGNKVRKLEFLLADAKRAGAKRIITSGAAGSNHALATALYARQCGFAATLMLFEQPPGPAIGETLLADFASGAEMFHDGSYPAHLDHLREVADHWERAEGVPPYIIPAGGSGPVGIIGFVNAAFELAQQIALGLLPEPAAIYVAFGTMGTVAGLLLGLRAARLQCRLTAVRVVPEVVANRAKFNALFSETNSLLISGDNAFPRCTFDDNDLSICDDYFGDGYGIATPAALSAIDEFAAADGMALDPVYTGKTGAAFLADARNGTYNGKPLLYWHTKNSRPLPSGGIDFHRLGTDFHRYFTAASAI